MLKSKEKTVRGREGLVVPVLGGVLAGLGCQAFDWIMSRAMSAKNFSANASYPMLVSCFFVDEARERKCKVGGQIVEIEKALTESARQRNSALR